MNKVLGKEALKIGLLFILPILLIKLGIIPVEWRFVLLYIWLLLIIGLAFQERYSLKELGIRTDNVREAIVPYTLFTIVGIVFILGIAYILDRQPAPESHRYGYFAFLFIPVSLVQEFIYRSYLLTKLERIFYSPTIAITINAFLFAFLHIIYPQPLALFPIGLLSGFAFALLYHRYPNLLLISLSHMILNYVTTLHCFFTIAIQGC